MDPSKIDKTQITIGKWVTQFFVSLDDKVRYAIIHGYENGFGSGISDVDLAISADGLREFLDLLREYSEATGWAVAQVFQHEVTAWYVVCVNPNDPREFAALDICTDYRVRGHLVLTANELLANRCKAAWGGWQCDNHTKFSYCIAKAAAKKKSVESILQRERLIECSGSYVKKWLLDTWGVELARWEKCEVSNALRILNTQFASQKWSLGEIGRLLSRLIRPAGYYWWGGYAELKVLSGLFRREERADDVRFLGVFPGLLGSTLWIGPTENRFAKWLNCSGNGAAVNVIQFLEKRTQRRWYPAKKYFE